MFCFSLFCFNSISLGLNKKISKSKSIFRTIPFCSASGHKQKSTRNISGLDDRNLRCNKWYYLKRIQYPKCVIYCQILTFSPIDFLLAKALSLKRKKNENINITQVKYILMVLWKEKPEMMVRTDSAWMAQTLGDAQTYTW